MSQVARFSCGFADGPHGWHAALRVVRLVWLGILRLLLPTNCRPSSQIATDIVGSCSPLEGDVGPRADKLNRARKGPVFSCRVFASDHARGSNSTCRIRPRASSLTAALNMVCMRGQPSAQIASVVDAELVDDLLHHAAEMPTDGRYCSPELAYDAVRVPSGGPSQRRKCSLVKRVRTMRRNRVTSCSSTRVLPPIRSWNYKATCDSSGRDARRPPLD